MKAVHLSAFGSTDQFEIVNVPNPSLKDKEVLVEVKAFAINPVEAFIRAGKGFTEYFEGLNPRILGWDIAGTVVRVGNNVENFKQGDEVFGMINFPEPGNAYAEYVASPIQYLAKKPSNITWVEAAGACLAGLTAWQGIVQYGQVQKGNKVLILGASGGVGHYAVQIAHSLGAYVIGMASGSNEGLVIGLGADEFIDYQAVNFEDVVTDADFVLDAVGGTNSYRALKALKDGGHVVSLSPGAQDLSNKATAQSKTGEVMMVQPSGKAMNSLANLLASGQIKTYSEHTFPLEEIDKAHQQVETGKTRGKVVVKVT